MYVYIGFKTLFYAARHLDSTATYLPTGLHLGFFRSWPSLYLPSRLFFYFPCALFCFGIQFNVILGNLPSVILWTWPYRVSLFCSISFVIGSSNPICCIIVTFLILSILGHILFYLLLLSILHKSAAIKYAFVFTYIIA